MHITKIIIFQLALFVYLQFSTNACSPDCDKRETKPLPKSSVAEAFKKAALNTHNQYRGMHSVPSLIWDDLAAEKVAEWCKKLGDAKRLEHSPREVRGNHGENLYYHTSTKTLTAVDAEDQVAAATKAWYDEVEKYDFNRPSSNTDTKHFIQVIWKSSKKLGCGYAYDHDKYAYYFYICCYYSPEGNDGSKIAQNVPRPN